MVGLTFDESIDWSRFTVVTVDDLPGPNEVKHIEVDQPILAGERVRHVGEAVALVAGEDRDEVRRAVAGVTVEVEREAASLDFRVAPEVGAVQFGDDNVLSRLGITKGDVDSVWGSAAHVVEGVYETGAQEHVYIETQGMEAWVDDGGVVCVRGSMQCPYYVVEALTHGLGRGEDRVRVMQSATGGGFGGKEDYPSVIALHAVLLAMKSGRRVRIVYDRDEDMLATTKRHPSLVRHRTALDVDGKLLAQDIDVVLDAGAYVTLSPVVLSRAIIHAAGPYSCANVRIRGRAVLTNTTPFGAFRGFGAPQTHFANERHMDAAARAIGVDAVEFRLRNLIRDGETTATGQLIDDGTDREALVALALKESGYRELEREHESFNATSADKRRGVGIAVIHHGAGFTGAGEVHLASVVEVAGLADGRVELRTANTEMGQGCATVFAEIAAHRLGVGAEWVVVEKPDSSRVPDSGPTVASRTTMVVGRLIERAIDDLLEKVGAVGARGEAALGAIRDWVASSGEAAVGRAQYEKPPGIAWDEKAYRGDAYGTFAWAACVAEVEVDLRTYTAQVRAMTTVQEVGRVINETLARGQIQGGVVQAIGWALHEDCVWRDGAMVNNQLTNYIIPTSGDTPDIGVVFLENPYEHGAMGSKGIGELPMDGPAPSIANAVSRALGVRADRIPLVPERIMELVEGRGGGRWVIARRWWCRAR